MARNIQFFRVLTLEVSFLNIALKGNSELSISSHQIQGKCTSLWNKDKIFFIVKKIFSYSNTKKLSEAIKTLPLCLNVYNCA